MTYFSAERVNYIYISYREGTSKRAYVVLDPVSLGDPGTENTCLVTPSRVIYDIYIIYAFS